MANTTSGTVTFDKTFAVDDLIAEAYERIGSQVTSGYQLKSARRSLNIMFQEWGNRGLHYWEVAESNIDLIEGQTEYFLEQVEMEQVLVQMQHQMFMELQIFLKQL